LGHAAPPAGPRPAGSARVVRPLRLGPVMAATSQGPSGFRNAETALGGADAVPDTVQAPNPGAGIQHLRKGESPGHAGPGPAAGTGPGISVVSIAVLLAIVALVLLMMFGGFGMQLPSR
jgi:hypothetical protein